jgi:hypothetical protein
VNVEAPCLDDVAEIHERSRSSNELPPVLDLLSSPLGFSLTFTVEDDVRTRVDFDPYEGVDLGNSQKSVLVDVLVLYTPKVDTKPNNDSLHLLQWGCAHPQRRQ